VRVPAVAARGANVVVMWERRTANPVTSQWDTVPYFAVSSDGGQNFSQAAAVPGISGTTPLAGRCFDLVLDATNTIAVVAEDRQTGGGVALEYLTGTLGGSFTTPLRITQANAGSYAPRLALSGATVHVSWVDRQVTGTAAVKTAVRYVRSTNGGSSFSNPRTFTNSGTATEPMLVSDGPLLLVGWFDSGGLFVTRSGDGGATFASAPVSMGAGSMAGGLAMDSAGNALAVWTHIGSATGWNWDVFVARTTDGGVTWGTPRNHTRNADRMWYVSRIYSREPAVTQANGAFTFAWSCTYPASGPYIWSY